MVKLGFVQIYYVLFDEYMYIQHYIVLSEIYGDNQGIF